MNEHPKGTMSDLIDAEVEALRAKAARELLIGVSVALVGLGTFVWLTAKAVTMLF